MRRLRVVDGWSWLNDDALGYTNWAPNEPSDNGTYGEDCVEMYPWSGQWNDIGCSSTNGFICMVSQRECRGFSLTSSVQWILACSARLTMT